LRQAGLRPHGLSIILKKPENQDSFSKKGNAMKWKAICIISAISLGASHAQIISDASAHPVVANTGQIKRYVVQLGPSGPNPYDKAIGDWNMVASTNYFSYITPWDSPSPYPAVDRIHGLHFIVYNDGGKASYPLKFPPAYSNPGGYAGGNWHLQYDNDGWIGVNATRGFNRRSTFYRYGWDFDNYSIARGYLIIEHH
jgi:hypothetical protein